MSSEIELEIKKQAHTYHGLVCLKHGCFEKATHTFKVGRIQDKFGTDIDLCDDHIDAWDECWRDVRGR